MATLIGSVPPGFTFQDLVGSLMTDASLPHSVPAKRTAHSTGRQLSGDSRMRIYLPDGAMREMTLTEYQDFLVSYHLVDIRQAVEGGACVDSRQQGAGRAKEAALASPALDQGSRDRIGQHLRAMYEQLLEAPLPHHLLTLVARLEAQDHKQSDAVEPCHSST